MGTGNGTEIKFAIKAPNLIKAQDIARKMPSVKHTRMIMCGHEISAAEYFEYRKVSAYERYGQKKYG
jgi:hypothetical protein